MICVSIKEATPKKCLQALKGIDFAEIRIDKMEAEVEDIKKIFSKNKQLIATCRPGTLDDQKRLDLLLTAISAGAAFVDIEFESDDQYKNIIIEKARLNSCRVIISYHNFEKTPGLEELERIIDSCFKWGADIAKIACLVQNKSENARLLGLLSKFSPLVIVGIGIEGKITRIVAPFLGSLFTYASLAKGKETAEGQIDKKTLMKVIEILKNV